MSYLAAFPVRTSVQPVRAQESQVSVQAYGARWHELLVKYDLNLCLWKTHQCLFPEDLHWSSVTLPKWGMTRTGHVYQHPTLERPISAIASGLLPTPSASERSGTHKPGSHLSLTKAVNGWIKGKLGQSPETCQRWPTPKASDWNKRGNIDPTNPRNGLAGAVKLFPTPRASDCKRSGSPSELARHSPSLAAIAQTFPTPQASDANKWSNQSLAERKAKGQQVRLNTAVSPEGGAGGQLNPDWVEWLMGWPIGWTDLKPLEMDRFLVWQQQHSEF